MLLLQAQDADGSSLVAGSGGSLDPDESFEEAARRELREETGRDLQIVPWIWTRRAVQYERYFVARSDEFLVTPIVPDTYVIGYRWWTLEMIRQSTEDFTPRRLADLLPQLMRGEYPDPAIDCGE